MFYLLVLSYETPVRLTINHIKGNIFMGREGIIIIVCIGIVVLFYLFADKDVQVERVVLVNNPAPTSIQDALKSIDLPPGALPEQTLPDSLESK